MKLMCWVPRAWRWPAVLALTAVLASGSAAACNLTISEVTSTTWRGNRGHGYDVYDSRRQALAVTFRVRTTDGGCSFFVAISPASAPSGGAGYLRGPGGVLRYEVAKDGSGATMLKPRALASSNEVFSGTFASESSNTSFQFAIIMPPEQVVYPGQYRDELELEAYDGTLTSNVLRDRRRVNVIAPVPAVAELSFSGGAGFDPNYGTYTVNFGNLRSGDRRTVVLKARGNGGYRIGFRSENGALRHINPSDGSTVPYSTTVDGATFALPRATTVQAIVNNTLTSASGQQHRLEFQVGDVGDASAGDYRDVINLTVFSLR